MAYQLQLRRGTNAQNAAFTGAQGEPTMDTTNNRIVVHDGVTAGGHPTANVSDINDSTIFFDDDTAGGSVADAYILTPKTNSRTPASYFDGLQIGFVTANTNTGASTADFAGLGPKNIKTSAGSDPSASSVSGRVELVYDAGNDWLELIESNLSQSEEIDLKSGRENVINNSRFQINSLGLSGVVSLSAGESAHDGWVAGASGCTYTFAETLGVTTLTITAGTLTQVVSGDRFLTGDYVLSWDGTAQARIDAGSYGNSGTVTASLSGGTPTTIEFNTGTVTKAQLELGAFATNYQVKREAIEQAELGINSLGVGQTWQNMTASRSASTTYTNDTGKPIKVRVVWGDSTGNGLGVVDFTVDGNSIDEYRVAPNTAAVAPRCSVGEIVPAGSTYSSAGGTNDSIQEWWELR